MLNNTNLIGLASADSAGPIYAPDDVYVGAIWGPGTATINLPQGTQSVVFATASTSKSNLNVTSVTLGGAGATMMVQTYQTQEYYKGAGIWAVNYSGAGSTTLSFSCGAPAIIMIFALKRRFVSVGVDDTGIDVGCGGTGQPFDAYLDLYKDGLTVCAWRPYWGSTSINAPFSTFWDVGGFASSLLIPTTSGTNALVRAYTQGDQNTNCDDGASMAVASFRADRFA